MSKRTGPALHLSLPSILRQSWNQWIDDGAFRISAALAYYAIFSMAPLLIILTFLVGLVYSGDTVDQVRSHLSQLVDPAAADLVAEAVVKASSALRGGFIYTGIAIVVMLLGASAFSYQLQLAMNSIWNIGHRTDERIIDILRKRLSTLGIVFFAGVVLQLSVVISALVSAYKEGVQSVLPHVGFIWHWLDLGVSFAVVSVLFAFVYKWLPDALVAWRDVWVGAITTAALFSIGKSAIAAYVSRSGFESIYGAAGSLMMLLAWVYYSSLILLFGAEFTQSFARSRGRAIVPRLRA
jgi:membrane protein